MIQNGIIIEKNTGDRPMVQHYHNANELIFILEGGIDVVISGKKTGLSAPALLFISNLQIHSTVIRRLPCVRYTLLVPNEVLYQMPSGAYLGSLFTKCLSSGVNAVSLLPWEKEAGELFSAMYREYREQKPFYPQTLNNYLSCLLIQIARRHPELFLNVPEGEGNRMLAAREYIDRHFAEDLSVKTLADQVYMSESYFSHTFKKVMSLSPKQYIMSCRIAQARQMLLCGGETIGRIAFLCGFKDVNNFIRRFKKEAGVSPLKYRRDGQRY